MAFAEDPIEKTRLNRRGNANTQRCLPDRAQLEEIREQALNNFMISPWVTPLGADDETPGSG